MRVFRLTVEGGGGFEGASKTTAIRCEALWMGRESAFGVCVSGPGVDWKADFISLKEETKEDAL